MITWCVGGTCITLAAICTAFAIRIIAWTLSAACAVD